MIGIRGLAAGVAIAAGLLVPSTESLAAGAPSAPDEAATLAYLRADAALVQADVEGLPAVLAAVKAQAARLQGECPGVLAAAPQRFGFPRGPLSGRARGEAARSARQLNYLEDELQQSLVAPLREAEVAHLATFAAAVLPLRWSDPRIAKGVQAAVTALQANEAPAQVCADMRFWAASGFKEVSPATRAFVTAQDERLANFPFPVQPLLVRFERTPAARAVLGTIHALRERSRALSQPLEAVSRTLARAIGLHTGEDIEAQRPKPGVVVARGRTAAGERWVARVRRGTGCGVEVTVGYGGIGGENSTGWCERNSKAANPSVDCNDGRLTVSSSTLPDTTLVRLRLSNGHTIASAPIRVPKRLGGPFGIYFQVVRGPSPIPRLLTEFDASGHVLRITHLPRVVECTRHPIKYLDGGPETLATGTVPGGPRFSIIGRRYRFLGKVYFELKVHVVQERTRGLAHLLESSGEITFGSSKLRRVFAPEQETSCVPHPYEIVYGWMHEPRETVVAEGAGPPAPLTAVPLPASLHERGELLYGAFSPPPTKLALRGPSGRTLFTEPLETGELVERCEGEAEPGGPLP